MHWWCGKRSSLREPRGLGRGLPDGGCRGRKKREALVQPAADELLRRRRLEEARKGAAAAARGVILLILHNPQLGRARHRHQLRQPLVAPRRLAQVEAEVGRLGGRAASGRGCSPAGLPRVSGGTLVMAINLPKRRLELLGEGEHARVRRRCVEHDRLLEGQALELQLAGYVEGKLGQRALLGALDQHRLGNHIERDQLELLDAVLHDERPAGVEDERLKLLGTLGAQHGERAAALGRVGLLYEHNGLALVE